MAALVPLPTLPRRYDGCVCLFVSFFDRGVPHCSCSEVVGVAFQTPGISDLRCLV